MDNQVRARIPRHIVESQQFDRSLLMELFRWAKFFEEGGRHYSMRERILASLFYEPSTRTRLSFEAAAIRLGGQCVGTENGREFSSAMKGETLEDTIRVVDGYADVIVLRHEEDDAAQRAIRFSRVPLINAGSGKGQHPTQALLDLYTIWVECGTLDGLTVMLVGDLAYGRTARSLAYLLSKFAATRLIFVSPKSLCIGDDLKNYLDEQGVAWEETDEFPGVAWQADALYMTRSQTERHAAGRLPDRYYCIDEQLARKLRGIIMHPLPRNAEIAPEVDECPNAAYFRQARRGLYVRMALLHMMFAS